MDDNRFDDIIKRKVGEYEVPGFDASALTALHHQMGSIPFSPWYSRYRMELLIGTGIVISTALIILALWFFNNQKIQGLNKNTTLIELQQKEIQDLKQKLDALKNRSSDTVYIRQENVPVQTLLREIAVLELIIRNLTTAQRDNISKGYLSADAVTTPLSGEMIFDEKTIPATIGLKPQPSFIFPQKTISNDAAVIRDKSGELSVKTLRKLEKHYHKGVGIHVGPTLEFSRGFYEAGGGRIDYSGGVLGDFILSPSLSIEAGGKFIHRFYEISEEELGSSNVQLPNVNADLEPIVSADVDSWAFEFPVYLKYRVPMSLRTHLLAGVGYSSLITTKQIFEYDYRLEGHASVLVNESHSFNNLKLYNGTLNISLGLSRGLKNKKILETSLYYQHGLRDTGVEKMRSNFLGLRTAYWFTLR